ncbi:isocitrate lyase/phosphoenolpyruvate mutase family protein [Viridibacterium curvum]|uniref:Isocitrate lyase/phosphoenolpyruvate mutase family protein n=1 Tax=Viridibacterium curvum TaxID=1101404 RepID=A0ABP9QNP5_9RHOO
MSATPVFATTREKAEYFQALHRSGCFIVPNPWDAGSARIMAHAGAVALATTGAGCAFARGLPDHALSPDQLFDAVADIVQASPLPVTVDLEDGFHVEPEHVAESIRRVAALGAVGASIEDKPRTARAGQYPVAFAAARVQAAAEAARALPHPFVLTARAENFFGGAPDLDDTILRLQAYQAAGADVLFAPGLQTAQQVATVISAVARPLNVLAGVKDSALDYASLAALGVRRISVGGALQRLALSVVHDAVGQMLREGRFDCANRAISGARLNELFASGAPDAAR